MKWFQFPSKIIELESQGPFCYSLAEQKQSINKHLKANYPNMRQKYEWGIFSCFLTNFFRWLKKIFINSPHTEKHSLWLEGLFRVAFCFLQEKPRDNRDHGEPHGHGREATGILLRLSEDQPASSRQRLWTAMCSMAYLIKTRSKQYLSTNVYVHMMRPSSIIFIMVLSFLAMRTIDNMF